jgi:hypothetical protein
MPDDWPAAQGIGLPSGGVNDMFGLPSEGGDVLRGAGDESTAGSSGGKRGVGSEAAPDSALERAMRLRFPVLSTKTTNSSRVNLLALYIEQLAIMRGDLEEMRLEAHVQLRGAKEALKAIPIVGAKSKAAGEAYRRATSPLVARKEDGSRWLVDRCTEQIDRMRADYESASRVYTMISGG